MNCTFFYWASVFPSKATRFLIVLVALLVAPATYHLKSLRGFTALFWVLIFSCLASTARAEEALSPDELRSAVEQPGLSWLRGERYDAFTGVFNHQMVDMRIPGNGTLDIVVTRDDKSILVPRLAHTGVPGRTSRSGSYSGLKRNRYFEPASTASCEGSTSKPASDTLKTPIVFDLYGKKINFFSTRNPAIVGKSRFPSNAKYVSPSNWHITCSDNRAYKVHSPGGKIWHFDRRKNTYHDAEYGAAHFVSKVTDAFGNSLVYAYAIDASVTLHKKSSRGYGSKKDSALITAITASDGRKVTFSYSGEVLTGYSDNGSPRKRSRTVSTESSGTVTRWIREDGQEWYYKRQNGLVAEVRYPEGMKISYEMVQKPKLDYLGPLRSTDPGYSSAQYWTHAKRILHNTGSSQTWTLSGERNSHNLIRTVSAPTGSVDFHYHTTYRWESYKQPTLNSHYDRERSQRGQLLKVVRSSSINVNLPTLRSKGSGVLYTDSGLRTTEHTRQGHAGFFDRSKVSGFNNRGGYYQADVPRLTSVKTWITDDSGNGLSYTRSLSVFDSYNSPRVIVETRPAGGSRTTSITYSHSTDTSLWRIGRWSSKTVSGVGSESRTFDHRGPVKSHTVNRITTNYQYDDSGNLSKVTDAEGHYGEFSNYYRGVPRTERDPNGNTRYLTVNSDGTVRTESLWGNSGRKWTYAYDSLRRVSSVTSPISGNAIKTFTWNTYPSSRTTTLTEKLGGKTTQVTAFNALQLPISKSSYASPSLGNASLGDFYRSDWEYDVLGRLKKQTLNVRSNYLNWSRYKSGAITEFSYDGLNRIVTEKHTLANGSKKSATYKYGFSDNYLYVQRTGLRGKITRTLLDAYGSPNTAWPVNINRAGVETDIERDVVGRVTSLTQGGVTRSYRYRSAGTRFEGLLLEEIHPETGRTTYIYKDDGEIDRVLHGESNSNQTTYFHYHNNNQLQRINRPGSNADVNYAYNPDGSLKYSSVDNGTIKAYEYDNEGKLTKETINAPGKTFTLDYGYNQQGNLASMTYPTGRTYQFDPDILGFATEIKSSDKTLADNLSYWANGALAESDLGSALSFKQSLTANNLPDLRTTRTNNAVKLQHNYGYDNARNVASIAITGDVSDSLTMTYDDINRLETVSSTGLGHRRFEYDDEDNIDWIEVNGTRSNYSYDDNNRLTSISGPLARWGFRYDARGNTLDNGKVDLTFNAANQVVSTSDGNSYAYDGHGRRVRTTKNGKHVYNVYGQNGVLRYRYDATNDVHSEYHYIAGKLVARRDSSSIDSGGGNGGGSGGSGGSGSGGSGVFVQPGNGVVSMEAESATLESGSSSDRWEVQSFDGASAGSGVIAVGSGYYGGTDASTYALSPRLHWQVTADRSGNHDVWVRTYTKNGSTDSVHLSLDNTFKGTYWHGSADYNKWVWKKLSVSMTSGQTHTVTLWAREMGIAIDKIVLVPTGTNVPSGSGPTETTRDGSGTGGGTGGSGKRSRLILGVQGGSRLGAVLSKKMRAAADPMGGAW